MKTIALCFALLVSALCQTEASSPPAATSVQVKPNDQQPVELFTPQADLRVADSQDQAYPVAIQSEFVNSYRMDLTSLFGTITSIPATHCLVSQDDHPANQRGRTDLSILQNASTQSGNLVNSNNLQHRRATEDPTRRLVGLIPQALRIRDPRKQLC